MTQGRRLRIGIAACAILLLVAQGLAVVSLLETERRSAIEGATRVAERTGHAVRDAINRSLFQVYASLAGLPALLAPFIGDGTPGPEGRASRDGLDQAGINNLLRHINSQNFAYRDLILVDAAGRPVAAALAASR